ncbi:MAG: hypothetical protein IPG72_02445 [Ardenticatenales bacterium]|jgi:hypothetical protein|nr:hypothetical protein [Ardenticatenales bacterium]
MTTKTPRTRDTLRAISASDIGLVLHRSILVREPIDRILRGLVLQRSGDNYVITAFVQPLYLPRQNYRRGSSAVDLSLGIRLRSPGGGSGFDVNDLRSIIAAIRAQGLAYLDEVANPSELAQWYRLTGDNDAALAAIAYSLVASGRRAAAIMALRRLIAFAPGDERDWVVMQKQEYIKMLELVQADMMQANELLVEWELVTRAALRL